MISIKSAVVTALQTSTALTTLLGTGQRIFFQYPDEANISTFPRVTYFEIDNTGSLYADNQEIGSTILFQIDPWSKSSVTDIAKEIDTIMTGLDFVRVSAPDLYESDTKVHHKAMRYARDIADPIF